jgi:hypothetical protein
MRYYAWVCMKHKKIQRISFGERRGENYIRKLFADFMRGKSFQQTSKTFFFKKVTPFYIRETFKT